MIELKKLSLNDFYLELNWPIIPNDVCDELIEYAKSAPNIWAGKDFDFKQYEQYTAPMNLIKWVKEFLPFIPDDYIVRLQSIPRDTVLRPHKDALRTSSYNFVLTEDGGQTNWHNISGQIIHSVTYKSKVWYHHQSQITHSVDSISSSRLAVTIFKFEIQSWFIKKTPSVIGLKDI
jgi:hypothetical protein